MSRPPFDPTDPVDRSTLLERPLPPSQLDPPKTWAEPEPPTATGDGPAAAGDPAEVERRNLQLPAGGVPPTWDPTADVDLVTAPSPEEVEAGRLRREARKRGTLGSRTRVNPRHAAFLRGEVTVADLDDQELKRGQFRSSDGKFHARDAANVIPREFHQEILRRIIEVGEDRLREDYLEAIEAVKGVMKNPMSTGTEVMKAAEMIMVRVAGKPAEKVEATVTVKKYEEVMGGIMVRPGDGASVVPLPPILARALPGASETVYDGDGRELDDDDVDG